MNPLQANPETGYLESRNPSLVGFTSDKKVKFLQLAYQMAELGQMPSVPKICETVGIQYTTFYSHLKDDGAFKDGWEQCLNKIEDILVNTMVTNGQRPSGYMDRITWLRAYRGDRWNPERRLQILNDTEGSKTVLSHLNTVIDGEIAPNEPNPAVIAPECGNNVGQPTTDSKIDAKQVDNQ